MTSPPLGCEPGNTRRRGVRRALKILQGQIFCFRLRIPVAFYLTQAWTASHRDVPWVGFPEPPPSERLHSAGTRLGTGDRSLITYFPSSMEATVRKEVLHSELGVPVQCSQPCLHMRDTPVLSSFQHPLEPSVACDCKAVGVLWARSCPMKSCWLAHDNSVRSRALCVSRSLPADDLSAASSPSSSVVRGLQHIFLLGTKSGGQHFA